MYNLKKDWLQSCKGEFKALRTEWKWKWNFVRISIYVEVLSQHSVKIGMSLISGLLLFVKKIDVNIAPEHLELSSTYIFNFRNQIEP